MVVWGRGVGVSEDSVGVVQTNQHYHSKKHQCMLTCNYKPSIRDLFEFVGISIVTAQSQEPV